jgi:hypothetical protein
MRGSAGWGYVKSGLVGAVVAAVVLLAFPAAGAVGSGLILGQGNSADAVTSLSGAATANLRITNSQAGAPALDLRVVSGSAPLKVNSTTRVPNLNADRLDGKHGGAYLLATGKAADADLLDGLDATAFAPASHGHTVPPPGAFAFYATAGEGQDVTIASAGTLSLALRCSPTQTILVWKNSAATGYWYTGDTVWGLPVNSEVAFGTTGNPMETPAFAGKSVAFTLTGDVIALDEHGYQLGHDNGFTGTACVAVGSVTLTTAS